MQKQTGYELSRNWFDFCFENPEKIKPSYTALYFYIIDRWNRFGQKDKFGLPTYHTMEALGIKSKDTYFKTFNSLVQFGFITVIEKSKNQNSANIISLCAILKNRSADMSALDTANVQQTNSSYVSTVPIDKQLNKGTNKQINNKDNFELFWNYFHQVTGKQKTDKDPAFKYWNKLDIETQRKAFKNIKPFYDSLENKEFCKKARTYLSDKSFNDEFTKGHVINKDRILAKLKIMEDEEEERKNRKVAK